MILMKFDGKYARCNGIAFLARAFAAFGALI